MIFKHAQDRLPVTVILSLSLIDFGLYFWLDNVALLASYWLLMLVPKGLICAWCHHHQHNFTFRSLPLNRVLEFFYGLHTGATSNLWVLHHNLGHHRNYLDQSKDESRWQRSDGSIMGMLEYTLSVCLTAHYRSILVGKRHPKQLKALIGYATVTLVLVGVLTWFRPEQGLFLFILPMISSLLFTCWATYEHHTGLDTDNPYEASNNVLSRWYNILTGNLGYHTAHHLKQGLHWSKLPEFHNEIRHKIPAALYHSSTFDDILPE